MRLNIGAGPVRRDGYLSVDVRQEAKPDIVSAAWDLRAVASNSVMEIYSRHMIEHLDPNDARRTLARWAELLRPLARALSEAGFDRIARQFTGQDSEPWHLNMVARKPDTATARGGI
jgi:predicted SAM-dependent methyltransferase